MYDLQKEKNNKILINYLDNKNFSQNLHNKQSLIDIIFQHLIDIIFKNIVNMNYANCFKLIAFIINT